MTLHQRGKKLKVIIFLAVACGQVWVKHMERIDCDSTLCVVVKQI